MHIETSQGKAQLNPGINISKIPAHIAFIMDGNGRWAKKRGLQRSMGHQRGIRAIKNMIQSAIKYGVKYLTFYAFSTENFNRPKDEVSFLMNLATKSMVKYANFFLKHAIRFKVIGDLSKLPVKLQENITNLQHRTENFSTLTVTMAINYGAREEIVYAVKSIVNDSNSQSPINWETIASRLYTNDIPDPDMIVRTSGEQRLSNFLLLQAAYSEFYFTNIYWPDVTEDIFIGVLCEYSKRERKMGNVQ